MHNSIRSGYTSLSGLCCPRQRGVGQGVVPQELDLAAGLQ
jgi:hypothetical protein